MIEELASYLFPGIPVDCVALALSAAAGQELASGKFGSPESSSALAVNGPGPFLDNPSALPPFPGLHDLDWPALSVDIERQMRFPWSGGRHPWLDAAVETVTHLIGGSRSASNRSNIQSSQYCRRNSRRMNGTK